METVSKVGPKEINLKPGQREVVGDNVVTRLSDGSLEVKALGGWSGKCERTTIVKPAEEGVKVLGIGRDIRDADGEVKRVETVFRV